MAAAGFFATGFFGDAAVVAAVLKGRPRFFGGGAANGQRFPEGGVWNRTFGDQLVFGFGVDQSSSSLLLRGSGGSGSFALRGHGRVVVCGCVCVKCDEE